MTLPETMRSLSQLRVLRLNHNQLTAFPEVIGCLQQLQDLGFNHNQLTTLPRSVVNLQSITVLNLRNNPLAEHGEGDSLGWLDLRRMLGDSAVAQGPTPN